MGWALPRRKTGSCILTVRRKEQRKGMPGWICINNNSQQEAPRTKPARVAGNKNQKGLSAVDSNIKFKIGIPHGEAKSEGNAMSMFR